MKKILIVDDSEMNRALLKEILGEQYSIVEAESGSQAIDILSEHSNEFSLVLLDIIMQDINGFDLLSYINHNHWNNKFAVMMISADGSVDNINRAYEMGAFDYIKRPFNSTVVRRRIANTMLLYARQQRLEETIAAQYEEQEKNSKLMISILSHIVEFRNGESGMHIQHVNVITNYLLRQLVYRTNKYQLSPTEIELITTAASLHDIGKIAIPDEIINKPGRLTREEFEVMKTHSTTGANMLLDLPIDQQVAPLVKTATEICRWHHERYDGRGYPDGLKGDEIPISAQVVSMADVYDALTSKRCYKDAYSHKEAIDMILNGECGVFNPILIECLKDISNTLEREFAVTETEQSYNNIINTRSKIDYNRILSSRNPQDNAQ